MSYNSNHIEGNSLNEEQTRYIFETNSFLSSEVILVDDIMDIKNHFKAFDYCIDIAQEPLTEEIIKKFLFILKSGEYKSTQNYIASTKTTPPKNVEKEMKKLLNDYIKKDNITFEDIVKFHYDFECIHPFYNGNGRVGRLIAFKECLRHNIIPFIIQDQKKMYYYRGLREFKNEPGYLIDTCYDGQDYIKKILKYLEII